MKEPYVGLFAQAETWKEKINFGYADSIKSAYEKTYRSSLDQMKNGHLSSC